MSGTAALSLNKCYLYPLNRRLCGPQIHWVYLTPFGNLAMIPLLSIPWPSHDSDWAITDSRLKPEYPSYEGEWPPFNRVDGCRSRRAANITSATVFAWISKKAKLAILCSKQRIGLLFSAGVREVRHDTCNAMYYAWRTQRPGRYCNGYFFNMLS